MSARRKVFLMEFRFSRALSGRDSVTFKECRKSTNISLIWINWFWNINYTLTCRYLCREDFGSFHWNVDVFSRFSHKNDFSYFSSSRLISERRKTWLNLMIRKLSKKNLVDTLPTIPYSRSTHIHSTAIKTWRTHRPQKMYPIYIVDDQNLLMLPLNIERWIC